MCAQNELSPRHQTNYWVANTNRSGQPPHPEPTPHPSCSGWRKRRSPTPSPLGRGLLPRVEGMPATTSVAPIPPLRDRHAGLKPGATSVAGRVRGHFIATPTQHKTQKIVGTNSTIYCSQRALTTNYPSKRTGHSAQNDPPQRYIALSRGERVARDGAFTSRRGSGEGSLHCHTHPAQQTENSGNELNDLLQTHNLARNVYTKRTVSEAPNELLGGEHESAGPASPIHEPTPHPSCSGWRKRRSPTPSPLGRGLYQARGGALRRIHPDKKRPDPARRDATRGFGARFGCLIGRSAPPRRSERHPSSSEEGSSR